MKTFASWFPATALAICILGMGTASADDEGSPSPSYGWRGNWTGLYPDADPPVSWGRIAKGIVDEATCQASKPTTNAASGIPLKDGFIRDWLVLGPFSVENSRKDINSPQVAGEGDLRPAEGDQVGQLAWKRLQLKKKPDYERWGTAELEWIDLAPVLSMNVNQAAYAHTYLYSPRSGEVVAVVDHSYGLRAWVNGEPVYTAAEQQEGLGNYMVISRHKQELTHSRSPRFTISLKQGWNRLLFKLTSAGQPGYGSPRLALRLLDAGPVPYEEKNIRWVTKLPERTNAVPIVVGDRLFTVAEPDELLCLDTHTGKILWRRIVGLFESIPEAQRASKPAFQEIEPSARELPTVEDYEEGLKLRREIRDRLLAADPGQFRRKWDGHLASHFAIVGFSTTPVSDGRSVYAFFGSGVAACFDLEGNRKWIRRLEGRELSYSCSPALIAGKLLVIFNGLHALDAQTGKLLWSEPSARSIASLIPARIRGTDVVFTRDGKLYRVSDGKLLWSNPQIHSGDTGWAAPVVLDEVMYLPWHGIGELIVADFSGVSGERWEPKMRSIEVGADHRRPDGSWLDRFTAGSPLIYDGIYYGIDQYGVFYAADLKSGKPLYKKDAGFDELHHYNAIGVAASPTLGGKHIYVLDNQGVCVVLKPGPRFDPVSINRIETRLPRDWPIGPQEILANGPPVFDGKRMYLRGEQYLYCIGQE